MIGRRSPGVDLMRFVFACIIVIHHSKDLILNGQNKFAGGSLGVEFFLLVSGYLMMSHIERNKSMYTDDHLIMKDTFTYIKKKLKTFYPEVFIAWLIGFVFTCIAIDDNIKSAIKRLMDACAEPFLLYSYGLTGTTINQALWYLSSMILCMAILYPLLRKFPNAMKYIIMPLSALFILGWLCKVDNHPRGPTKWFGFTYKGNIRTFAELQLGALCFYIVLKIKDIHFNRMAKTLLALVEVLCYLLPILYMYYYSASKWDIFFIALLCIGICLSFSGQTALSSLPENRIIFWLGKYSFPLYLSHQFYAKHLNDILPVSFTNNQRMMVYLLCSFLTALAVWGISALLRKNSGRILQAGKRLFVEKEALNV